MVVTFERYDVTERQGCPARQMGDRVETGQR
jgi:hypothetical protein